MVSVYLLRVQPKLTFPYLQRLVLKCYVQNGINSNVDCDLNKHFRRDSLINHQICHDNNNKINWTASVFINIRISLYSNSVLRNTCTILVLKIVGKDLFIILSSVICNHISVI